GTFATMSRVELNIQADRGRMMACRGIPSTQRPGSFALAFGSATGRSGPGRCRTLVGPRGGLLTPPAPTGRDDRWPSDQGMETTMSRKRGGIPCPSCGEHIREKALRCPSCGTTNPLQERPSFGERIGLGGTLVLLAVGGIILLVLGVWLTYELVTLG